MGRKTSSSLGNPSWQCSARGVYSSFYWSPFPLVVTRRALLYGEKELCGLFKQVFKSWLLNLCSAALAPVWALGATVPGGRPHQKQRHWWILDLFRWDVLQVSYSLQTGMVRQCHCWFPYSWGSVTCRICSLVKYNTASITFPACNMFFHLFKQSYIKDPAGGMHHPQGKVGTMGSSQSYLRCQC